MKNKIIISVLGLAFALTFLFSMVLGTIKNDEIQKQTIQAEHNLFEAEKAKASVVILKREREQLESDIDSLQQALESCTSHH